MNEQEIINRIRLGEVELFRELVERYQHPLLAFIQTITRDRLLTKDVGQAVFLSFYQSLDRFDETRKTPIIAWLYVAARNQAINAIKKEQRYLVGKYDLVDLCDNRPGPLDLLIAKEDQAVLKQCLDQLAEPYRSTLRYSLEGYSIKEIGAKEMILPGTVKSRLARARKKISAIMRTRMGS